MIARTEGFCQGFRRIIRSDTKGNEPILDKLPFFMVHYYFIRDPGYLGSAVLYAELFDLLGRAKPKRSGGERHLHSAAPTSGGSPWVCRHRQDRCGPLNVWAPFSPWKGARKRRERLSFSQLRRSGGRIRRSGDARGLQNRRFRLSAERWVRFPYSSARYFPGLPTCEGSPETRLFCPLTNSGTL
jgi:hypothetical protein